MLEQTVSSEHLERDWLGCFLTIAFLVGITVVAPAYFLWPDEQSGVSKNQALTVIILFSLFCLAVCILIANAYLVRVTDQGLGRGLFSQRKFLLWSEINHVEIGLQAKFTGTSMSIKVFPFVFKDEKKFYSLVEDKLGTRLQFRMK